MLQLYKLDSPSIDSFVEVVSAIKDIIIEEGQPAEFICQYSRPVRAIWKQNGKPVHLKSHRVEAKQDWTVARLCISSATSQDVGIYSCEAEGTIVKACLNVRGESTCSLMSKVLHCILNNNKKMLNKDL